MFTRCQYELKTAQKSYKTPLREHGTRSKLSETDISTGVSDLKTIPKRCDMKTEPVAVSCEQKIRYFFISL